MQSNLVMSSVHVTNILGSAICQLQQCSTSCKINKDLYTGLHLVAECKPQQKLPTSQSSRLPPWINACFDEGKV